MSSSSFATKFLLIVIAALALSSSAAFQVTPHRSSPGVTRRLTPLSMAADIDENPRLGPTEQLLIAAKERRELREQGYIQELGKTVRKDGLDGVRALVWSVYGASNVVFPALGFVFFAKELLHLAGHSI